MHPASTQWHHFKRLRAGVGYELPHAPAAMAIHRVNRFVRWGYRLKRVIAGAAISKNQCKN